MLQQLCVLPLLLPQLLPAWPACHVGSAGKAVVENGAPVRCPIGLNSFFDEATAPDFQQVPALRGLVSDYNTAELTAGIQTCLNKMHLSEQNRQMWQQIQQELPVSSEDNEPPSDERPSWLPEQILHLGGEHAWKLCGLVLGSEWQQQQWRRRQQQRQQQQQQQQYSSCSL
jgi:hypothetical protein